MRLMLLLLPGTPRAVSAEIRTPTLLMSSPNLLLELLAALTAPMGGGQATLRLPALHVGSLLVVGASALPSHWFVGGRLLL